MARHPYPFSAEALAEAVRFISEGKPSYPYGETGRPSIRDVLRHLAATRGSDGLPLLRERVNPAVMWRALQRCGAIALPSAPKSRARAA